MLSLAVVLSVLALWGARRVKFDYNLLNLQSKRTESVVWERRILETAGRSGFAAVASARSLEELRAKHAAFSKLSSVSEVDSALHLMPDDQGAKRKIIEDFAPIVTPVRVGRPRAVEIDRLTQALETLHRRLGIAANEAPGGRGEDEARRRPSSNIQRLIIKLRQTDPAQTVAAALAPAVPGLPGLPRQLPAPAGQRAPARHAALDDLPHELRQKFVSPSGLFLLRINPAVDIWELAGARRFVEELRSVDPDVTGTPVITYETITLMERSYLQATIYAIAPGRRRELLHDPARAARRCSRSCPSRSVSCG